VRLVGSREMTEAENSMMLMMDLWTALSLVGLWISTRYFVALRDKPRIGTCVMLDKK
jgi:hypothetical protein